MAEAVGNALAEMAMVAFKAVCEFPESVAEAIVEALSWLIDPWARSKQMDQQHRPIKR